MYSAPDKPARTDTVARGQRVETLACEYLQQQGLQILQRNYHTRYGELDIIAQSTATLVFVEVRYRRQTNFGSGAETVTAHKQHKLQLAAQHYLQQTGNTEQDCRFDVLSGTGEPVVFDWITNAF
ncbi:YraN family protein [Oceanobacter mangrovi]|uniref:YraN family protein n=1 Tax=Oceanobacter mangrovi TaxID=2862510 RepID=UPI001C8D7AC1|nr:YraN family protein [Oceanobacter mangrovi]